MLESFRKWRYRVTSEAGAYTAVIQHTRHCEVCKNGHYCSLGSRLERRWEKLQQEQMNSSGPQAS